VDAHVGRHFHGEGLMGSLAVVLIDKGVKAGLLLEDIGRRSFSRIFGAPARVFPFQPHGHRVQLRWEAVAWQYGRRLRLVNAAMPQSL
jgi:hypothetical protein